MVLNYLQKISWVSGGTHKAEAHFTVSTEIGWIKLQKEVASILTMKKGQVIQKIIFSRVYQRVALLQGNQSMATPSKKIWNT